MLALTGIGIVMVYSASYAEGAANAKMGSAFFVNKQLEAAAAGMVALAVTLGMSYRRLRQLSYPMLMAAIALLVAVLVVGVELMGAKRWLPLGPVQFQPSEFAKVALVLAGARFLSENRSYFRTTQGFVNTALVLGLVTVLIAKEDLGTAVALALGMMALFYLGGARKKHLAGLVVAAVLGAAVLIAFEPYRADRIIAWWHREDTAMTGSYQSNHAIMALGSGGLLGRGLCESREKFFYLPEASTDCIFAVIGEELGLVGALGVLGLFCWLGAHGYRVARKAPDEFSALVAGGATAMICGQALLNIAVVTGAIPTTGVPLPFISYGGTSLVFTLANAGLILNVSRGAVKPGQRTARRVKSEGARFERRGGGLHRRRPVMGGGG